MVYPTHSLTKRMKKSCPVTEISYNIHTHRRIGLAQEPLQLAIIINHCRPKRCIRRYIMYCNYMIYFFFTVHKSPNSVKL